MATAANTVHKLQKTQYVGANNVMVHNTDVVVQGNLTVRGTQTYTQTEVLLVKDNIITLNAAINQSGSPLFDAGIEVDRGQEQNVSLLWKETEGAWKFTNDGVNYETLGGGSAGSYANGAFLQANAAYNAANNASDTWVRNQANIAYSHANASYNFANTTTAWGTRQAFVATAGQTIFSPGSGYLPGYIDVYYNGIKLYGAEDYTATDGINVTLANPATVNSIIEVVGFGANVPVANVYVLNSMASLLNRQTFFATNGQTTFTPTQSYRVGYVDVYYNGLKMNIPEDVTANNGTTVNFIGLTPTTNDVIEIVGLTPNVALANAIPITGGTISGSLSLAGNVTPVTDNTYYLGSATNRWHSLFVGPGSVDIGGLKLSNVGGVLSVASPGAPATPIAGEDTWVRAQANAAYNAANSVNVYGANTAINSFFAIPQGNTAQRPTSAANGSIRYNTSLGQAEIYIGNAGWVGIIKENYPIEILIVAGGGGGGGSGYSHTRGGGAGAGGLLYYGPSTPSNGGSLTVVPGTSYSVSVGAGGSGGVSLSAAGANGSISSFTIGVSVYSAAGGGGGGSYNGPQGQSGGSGGGGGTGSTTAGLGTPSQGYPGGAGQGYANAPGPSGGGGGGANGTGEAGSVDGSGNGGDGGAGQYYGISGTSTAYAGGGGGGGHDVVGTGGVGGGGNGGSGASNGIAGTTNSGGGGGGASSSGSPHTGTGGAGGSGVVIVRYFGVQRATGGTIVYDGSYTTHTFTGSGTFTA